MSSTVPSIDCEEYRIIKQNREERTLALRREIRDNVDIQYYNDYCDKIKDPHFHHNTINSVRILVAELENLRDDVDEKNALYDTIHYEFIKTKNYVERMIGVLEGVVDNEKAFVMEIASLKQRQKEEYYDIRRCFLLNFMILIPLFPFFFK
jgi:hypothetical protein